MNLERNRLSTFVYWPSSAPVDPIRIAKAGFYYTGHGTEVICFSCGGKISDWNYGDQVIGRHRQIQPNCTFVVNPQLSGNVALVGGEVPASATSLLESEDEQTDSVVSSVDYGVTDEDEMYKCDALRLLSFINWEDTSVSREELVSAGLYHAGEGRLRCAWCGGELAPFTNFGSLGNPLAVHRRFFPICPHAERLERARHINDSVAIAVEERNLSVLAPEPMDLSTVRPQTSGAVHNSVVLRAAGAWRALGVVGGGSGARHPTRASLAARLATFTGWPADRAQAPKALAEAGFFYAGIDDQVRCFFCDGGLGKWEASDAPWHEHARWFPHCGYVLIVKGQPYVDSCKPRRAQQISDNSNVNSRRQNSAANDPFTDNRIDEFMESSIAMSALEAGLDAARVRRAAAARIRATGRPFTSAVALIDAVLDGQLGEEAWGAGSPRDELADRLGTALRESLRSALVEPPAGSHIPHAQSSYIESPWDETEERNPVPAETDSANLPQDSSNDRDNNDNSEVSAAVTKKPVSLEEENRQLKEARLCKVCMDCEVSVVFLPCGHLAACARCGAALGACPLCRAPVRALVRAYLA